MNLKSSIQTLAKSSASLNKKSNIDVSFTDKGFLHLHNREKAQYSPEFVPYLSSFLSDSDHNVKIVMGAYGSGKTSGVLNKILFDAAMMPMCDDGIRRSKWAFIRNTSGELETTTLTTWEYWAEGLPQPIRNKKPVLTYKYKFYDQFGLICMDIVFLALDRLEDVRKLDSLEITGCYFNELRHIQFGIFNVVQGRMGRYPQKIEFIRQFEQKYGDLNKEEKKKAFSDWEPYQKKLYADTNPPKVRHWIQKLEDNSNEYEKDFEGSRVKVYHQPVALLKHIDEKTGKMGYKVNSEADNLLYVGTNYYLDMIPRGEEYIKVYARGEYGTIVDGKPVYPNYNDDLHSVENLPINVNEILYMAWDFGTVSPACILKQLVAGQWRAIKEFCCDYETVESLFTSVVKPFLNTYCKGMKIISTHDPANTSEGCQQLLKCGIESMKCRTNNVEPRISATQTQLDRLRNGKPTYVISRQGCPILREGFIGEYHYRKLKVIGDEKYVDSPNKTHPYSDIHDANQYCDILIGDEIGLAENKGEEYDHNKTVYEDTRSKVTGY